MGDATAIEWADVTWNPIVGCQIVSPGCKHCYAMGQAARIERMAAGAGRATHYAGMTELAKTGAVWTGKVAMAPDEAVAAPMRWRRPRRIFVNSMGDLFAEGVTDAMRDRVWAVMACAPWHTFLVLTKRAAAMRAYVEGLIRDHSRLLNVAVDHPAGRATLDRLVDFSVFSRALPNIWLGVTAEDQPRADERIPELLATPAAVRFVSYEPAIGPVDFRRIDIVGSYMDCLTPSTVCGGGACRDLPGLDWVIAGGESGRGPGVRPMHPDWARKVLDDCAAAGVAFFFKQWGEWIPVSQWPDTEDAYDRLYHPAPAGHPEARRRCKVETGVVQLDGSRSEYMGAGAMMIFRVGKARAGRELDGRTHDAFPQPHEGRATAATPYACEPAPSAPPAVHVPAAPPPSRSGRL